MIGELVHTFFCPFIKLLVSICHVSETQEGDGVLCEYLGVVSRLGFENLKNKMHAIFF